MSNDGIIYIQDARVSFPNLATPQERVNKTTGEKKISYNCELILKPDHPGFAQFYQRYTELITAATGQQVQAVMAMIQNDAKSRCFGDGGQKVNKKTMKAYDGYPGNYYLTTGNKFAPQMIRTDGTAVDPKNTLEYQAVARLIYGGCRVNAAVRPWVQKPGAEWSWGIRCDLIAIQFHADDKPFGAGAPDASGMFGATTSPAGAAVPAGAAPVGATPTQPANAMPAPPSFAAPAQPAASASSAGLPPFLSQ